MWAQYAERHKGVCLAFCRDKLSETIEEAVGDLLIRSGDVRYTDYLNLSSATTIQYGNVERLGKEEAFRCHICASDLFFLKSRDWESEEEFRWVVLRQDDNPLLVPFGDALAAVILGADVARSNARALKDLLDDPVFRMSWTNGEPRCHPDGSSS